MDPQIPEIEEVPSILLPCSSCTRTFRPEALAKHTKVCEKSLMKKRKTFDSSKQRLQGTEVESFSPGAGTGSLRKTRGKERQEPAKVVQAGKERVSQTPAGKRTDLQSKVRPSDHTECPYCGRSFGPKSFERHAQFCKEQQLKLKSTPSNPEAKERLKVRTSYKGPLTHKVLTRDKYQPKRDPSPINIELRDVGSIGKGLRRNTSLRSSLRNSRGSHSISPPPLRRTMTQISPSTEARKPKKESERTRLTNGNQNQGVPRMVHKDPPDRKVNDRNLNNSVSFPKIPVFDKEANNNNIKYSQKHCRKKEEEWQTFGFGNVKDFKEVKNNFSSRPLSSTKNYMTVSEMETSTSEEVSSPGYMGPYRSRKLLPSPQYLKRSKTIKLIERREKKLLFTPNCQSEDSKEFSGTTENGENCLLLPNIVCIPNPSEDIFCTTSDNHNSITQNSKISQLMTKLTENIENQLSSSKDLSFYKAIDINLLVCPMELSSNAFDNNKQQNVGKKCDSQKKLENNVIPNSSNGESLKCNSDDHSQNVNLNLHDGLEVIQTQTRVLDKYSNIKMNEPVVQIANSQLCAADLSLADLEFLENKFISPSLGEKNESEESNHYPKSTNYDPLQISSIIPGNINPQTSICVPDIRVINQKFLKNSFYSPLTHDSSIYNLSSTPEYTSEQTIASEVMKEPITCGTLPIQNKSPISAKDNNCYLQKTNTFDIPIIPFNHHWTSSNSCENKQNLEKEALHINIKNTEKNIVHKGNYLSFTNDSLVIQNNNNIFRDVINLKNSLNQMECSRKRKKDVSKENYCSNLNNILYTENTENLRKIKKRSTYVMRTQYDNEHEKLECNENMLNAPLQTEACAGISIDKLGSLNNQSEKNSVLPLRNDYSFKFNYIENASKVVPHQNKNLVTYCLPGIMKQENNNLGKKENNLIGSSQSICYGVSSVPESDVPCVCLQGKIINKSNLMKIYPILEVLTINTGKAEIFGNTIDVMFSNTEKPTDLEQIILNETCLAEESPRKSGEYELTSSEVHVMSASELNTNAKELGSELSTTCGELDNFETHPTLAPSEISTKCNEFVSSETHSAVKTSEISSKCEELCNSKSHSTVSPSKMSTNYYEIVNSETHPTLTPAISRKCEELGNSEIYPTVTPSGISTNCKESVSPEVLMEYKELYNSECSSEMLINCSGRFFPVDHYSTEIYKIDAFCKELHYPEVHTSDNASENVEVTLDQWTVPNGIIENIEKNTINYLGCHSSTDSQDLMDNEHTNIHTALLKSPVYSVIESSKLIDPLSLDLGCTSNMTVSVPIVENHNRFACDNLMKYSPIHTIDADEFMVCNDNKLNACSNQHIPNKNWTKSDKWYITKSVDNTAVPSSPLGCSNLVLQDPNDLDTISEDSLECGSQDPFYGCEYFPSDSDSVFSDSLKEHSCKSPILFWNDRKLCNPKMSYNKEVSSLDGDYFSHQTYMSEATQKMEVDHYRTKANTNFHSHYSPKTNTEISNKNNRISEKSNFIFPLAVSKEHSKTAEKQTAENKYSSKKKFEGILYNNSEGMEENFSAVGIRDCSSDTETATCLSDIETNSAVYVKQSSKVVEYFQEIEEYHTVETSIYKFPRLEDNLGKTKYMSPKSPARYTSLPSQCSLTQNKKTSNAEGNLLKLPLIKKSQPSPACCNSLSQRNEALFSPLLPAKRCKSYKVYQSTSNPQYSDILFRGDEKVEKNRICSSSLYLNSVKDFDGTKTVGKLADDKLSYKNSSCLKHSSFANIKNILPSDELLNGDENSKFSYYENYRKSDPIKVDNLRSQFSHSARRTSSTLEAPFSTSIQSSRDKNDPKIPQRQLSMSIFPSIHHPKKCIGEGENYNPYLSAERQMMELFGGEGKRSPGGVPSPLQSSPSSAFVKYRSSSSESLKEAEESLRAAEESLKEAVEWEEEEVESNRLRKPDPLGLSSLSLCSVISIDSIDCNRNSEQGVVETKPRSGRVKVDMREMLYGGGEPPPPQADLQACEAELLLSMLEFEKMLKSSPIPSLQSSPTLCSSSPPDNDSNQNNNTTENHNNLKNLNQGSVDSAYSSLTRWSGGDGERNLPTFCHECGAKYPVSAAKFCCNCGIKRIALS